MTLRIVTTSVCDPNPFFWFRGDARIYLKGALTGMFTTWTTLDQCKHPFTSDLIPTMHDGYHFILLYKCSRNNPSGQCARRNTSVSITQLWAVLAGECSVDPPSLSLCFASPSIGYSSPLVVTFAETGNDSSQFRCLTWLMHLCVFSDLCAWLWFDSSCSCSIPTKFTGKIQRWSIKLVSMLGHQAGWGPSHARIRVVSSVVTVWSNLYWTIVLVNCTTKESRRIQPIRRKTTYALIHRTKGGVK